MAAKAGTDAGSGLLKQLLLMLGVWGSFMAYGWVLEDIKRSTWGPAGEEQRFKDTTFLIIAQSLCNSVVAAVILLFSESGSIWSRLTGGVPQMKWALVSAAYLGAHKFGIGALDYITYPVQVLVKCCKPIPVLLGEVVVAKEKHPPAKYLSVFLLVVGVIVFMFNKPSSKAGSDSKAIFEWSPDSMYGLLLVFLALVCDGIYGPQQNAIKKEHSNLKAHHNMLSMNFIQGAIAATSCLLFEGGVTASLEQCKRSPALVQQIGYMCITMAAGNLFIYELQNSYGSLTVTTTTTLRKLCSILFSVLWFGHAMAPVQWAGVVIVITAGPISKWLLPPAKAVKDSKKSQ